MEDVQDAPHRAIIEVGAQILVDLFKPGKRCYEVAENPIPEGARIYGAEYDALRDVWRIGVEHESFPRCPPESWPITVRPTVVRTLPVEREAEAT